MKPRVTVLMPVYNGEKFLREAIESILNQTFSDFELLVIDDGSKDASAGIIKSYTDRRIRIIQNPGNKGLIYTLNKGLELAEGEYVARMDSDDISLPRRLERQVRVMDENPDLGICGTWFDFINQDYKVRHPVESPYIKVHLLVNTAFGHPTVMLRNRILKEYQLFYDGKYKHSEDYEFFSRLSDKVECYNVPEVLLRYRDHPEQVSQLFWREQGEVVDRIRIERILALGLNPTDEEREVHLALVKADRTIRYTAKTVDSWLEKILESNRQKRKYDHEILAEKLMVLRKTYMDQNRMSSLLGNVLRRIKDRIHD